MECPTASRISVVLPVYCTAHCLRELYDRLVATLTPICSSFELVLVDDGSPDRAWPLIAELAAVDLRVKAIRLSRNFGQHPAICAGFEVATGDLIVLMDADLQDPPESIPTLVRGLDEESDIVYTIKQESFEAPLIERLTSRLYHCIFSRLTRSNVPANIGTFRLFTRRFLEAVLSYPERNILFGPLMFFVGFHSVTVPVPHNVRKGSRSAYTFAKRLNLAINSLLSYTDVPHRFLIAFGGLISIGSLAYMVLVVVGHLVTKSAPPPGLSLLAFLISFTLGALMLGLGIIGIYVFRVYEEVLRRPRYIVERKLNVSA